MQCGLTLLVSAFYWCEVAASVFYLWISWFFPSQMTVVLSPILPAQKLSADNCIVNKEPLDFDASDSSAFSLPAIAQQLSLEHQGTVILFDNHGVGAY